MVDETIQPVRCLIVPSDPGFLVIPSAAVAEIVPLALKEGAAEGNLLGFMAWRGIQVPVYSMEGLAGLSVPAFGKRSKAFIFYPWKGMDKNTFFAIATLHDPRPRLLSSDDIQASDDDQSDNAFIRASFRYDGEPALIPDLQAISQQQ
ncbi:MAG: chemotaxis protein CheW [Arenicellales bacterium]